MKVICWLEDVFRTDLPNIEKLQERDLYGRNADTLCVNNPDYRNFLTGLVEDYARSYDIDGIMWGSERQGALCDSLGPRMTRRRSIPARSLASASFVRPKPKSAASMWTAPARDFWSWKNSFARHAAANALWMATTFNSGGSCCAIPNWPHGKCSGPIAFAKPTPQFTKR